MNEDKKIREQHINILKDIFDSDKLFKKSGLDSLDIATQIELGCNNSAIEEAHKKYVSPINWVNMSFCHIYSAIFYKIEENLNPKSEVNSRFLIDQIIDSKIKLKKIASMSSIELCPEKNDTILQQKNIRINKKIEHKTTKRFQCPNCKKRKAQYKYVQLRSFDEGYNTSLTCIECSYKWVI